MEFFMHQKVPAVRFSCSSCGGAFIVKTKYLEISDLYPCPHCGDYREFTLADAFVLKDLRNAWSHCNPDPRFLS